MNVNKMNKLWISATFGAALALAGCAFPTDVLPIGPDTYSVSSRSPQGAGESRASALKVAGQFCTKLGKNILVRDVSFTGGGFDQFSVDLIFRCLSEGDPELKRPNLETRPDVVIQNRR